jgi:hypothetical protein
MDQRQSGIVQEAGKAMPPVSIAGMQLMGIAVSDWILILTGFYLVCQIVLIIPKVYHTLLDRRKK